CLLAGAPVLRHGGFEHGWSDRRQSWRDLFRRQTRLGPADDVKEPVASCVEPRTETQRNVDLDRLADVHAMEGRVGDADDRVRFSVERDRLADDRWRSSEFAFPETVAQYGDRWAPAEVISASDEA